jgi:hypothetical protein
MAPRRCAPGRWWLLAVAVLITTAGTVPGARAAPGGGMTVTPGICDAVKSGPIVRSDVGHVVLGCRASGSGARDLAARGASQGWTSLMDD